jgi:hypothetical protein
MSSSTASRSLLRPRAASAVVDREVIRITLRDGRELAVPIAWFPWLAESSTSDRDDLKVVEDGAGIWWDRLADGISVPWLFGASED